MKLASKEIKKIIVFRALQLGDLLCSIPSLRALRNAYPDALITLAGLPWAKSLVDRFPVYFNSFVQFPGYPGLPEQAVKPSEVIAFLHEIQSQNFDLVLQMQGNGTIVNPLVKLFGGKHTAGFCIKSDYCPDQHLFLQYPECIPEIERHINLMKYLGIPSAGTQLEFPITGKDEEDFQKLQLPLHPQKYVCIHPGSRGSWRQWPPQYFATLGDYCVNLGLQVVLTGTREEEVIVQEVMKHMKYQPINTAGKTNIGAVGVLIKNAYALISNCTGVSHMASAFKTPSIVISMDGEPERWAPLDKVLHRTIDWTKNPDFNLVFNEAVDLLKPSES